MSKKQTYPSFDSVVQRPSLYSHVLPSSSTEQRQREPLAPAQGCPKSCCSNIHFTKAYEENMIAEGRSSNRVTYEGKLVDMRCYSISLENHTQDHLVPPGKEKIKKNCATACCNVGIPAGLLVDAQVGGQVFVLLAPSTQLAPYMDKWVRVTGRVMSDSHALLAVSIQIRDENGDYSECFESKTPM